jgi:hypothetical protein
LRPGEFESYLAINKDGSYRFAYKGEMQLILPESGDLRAPRKPVFRPENEYCRVRINNETGEVEPLPLQNSAIVEVVEIYEEPTEDNSSASEAESGIVSAAQAAEAAVEAALAAADTPDPLYSYERQLCNEEQLIERKKQQEDRYQNRLATHKKRIEALNPLFGGALPGDDASMEKLAAKLENYAGWDSVTYTGNDVFQVSYNAEGLVSNGFTFPILADAAAILPFVQILPHKDGTYEVIAPGYGGSSSVVTLASLDRGASASLAKQDIVTSKGTFTLTTDSDVLANNSQKGLRTEFGRKVIEWDVREGFASPRALIAGQSE